MKSLKIPMTVDEFHLAEFPFGWKDEYCDGFAYITPRDYEAANASTKSLASSK